MSDIHKENMAAGIKSVFESSKYSDFTIRCRGKEFKVHRIILCPRSTFFAAACDGDFKEAKSAQITLDDDDLDTVERMLSYFYTLNYEDEDDSMMEELSSGTFVTPDPEGSPSGPSEVSIEAHSPPIPTEKDFEDSDTSNSRKLKITHIRMLSNISVHAIADKYDVPTLKKLAEIKFRSLAYSIWPHYEFPAIVKAVYESTSDNDRGLRTIVTSICANHIGDVLLLDSPSASVMKDIGQLGFDILRIVKENSDTDHNQLSSALAITELQLHDKTREAGTFKYERDLLKEKLVSWSVGVEDIVNNARNVHRCRHCAAQSMGSGDLRFERVDHPTDLRAILRCSTCRTKHSLD